MRVREGNKIKSNNLYKSKVHVKVHVHYNPIIEKRTEAFQFESPTCHFLATIDLNELDLLCCEDPLYDASFTLHWRHRRHQRHNHQCQHSSDTVGWAT